jgi:Protein of unknown function (DUF2794)
MEDAEPIELRAFSRRRPVVNSPSSSQSSNPGASASAAQQPFASITAFTRAELSTILAVYGRLMSEGEARDYAMDFGRDTAVFSIFRRTSDVPLYRIEKSPRLARKQGAYSVITPTGLILKRGHELARVLDVLAKNVRVVSR